MFSTRFRKSFACFEGERFAFSICLENTKRNFVMTAHQVPSFFLEDKKNEDLQRTETHIFIHFVKLRATLDFPKERGLCSIFPVCRAPRHIV